MPRKHKVKSDIYVEPNQIPAWILWFQGICFLIFYAFLYYPGTNFIVDTCMIFGALLSFYVLLTIGINLLSLKSIPFWMVLILILWMIVHLIFFNNEYEAQLRELVTIWKRVLIGAIFALGFGFNIAIQTKKNRGFKALVLVGLLAPTFIYLIKYCIGTSLFQELFNVNIPPWLINYENYGDSKYFIHKSTYAAFCVPPAVICIAILSRNLGKLDYKFFSYLLIFSIFLLFYSLINSKNAFVHTFITSLFILLCLLIEFIFSSFKYKYSARNLINSLFSLIFLFLVMSSIILHINNNPSWTTLIQDIQIGMRIDESENWKYRWSRGDYPKNLLGETVSISTYERAAWMVAGGNMIIEYPLGYGLVEYSFGKIAKKKWPEAKLDQSHNAWIDLILGVGWFGGFLILGSIFFVMWDTIRDYYYLKQPLEKDGSQNYWRWILFWGLFSESLVWLTAEVSQKNQLILLIFLAMWLAGVNLKSGK